MVSDFLYVYLILHAFFFLLSVHILSRFGQDIATQLEYHSFRFLIGIYLFYLVCNVSCTVMAYDPDIAPPRWAVVLLWYASILGVVVIALSLYMFTVFRYATQLSHNKWFTIFSTLPVGMIIICMLFSLKNGMILYVVDSSRVVYGKYYYLLPMLTMVYFVAILVFALYELNRTRSYIREKQLGVLIMSCVCVFTVVMLDTFFRNSYLSILPGGILVAIIFLYINMQDSGIYIDTLTGMNNRRKANEYLGEYLRESAEKTPIFLYMCDVNYFKHINDTYGHSEGDQALMLVAEALKGTMAWYEGFAARLGGDEFLLTWSPKNAENTAGPEAFIDDVCSALELECTRAQKPYTVTVSLGYTFCDDSNKTLGEYIREADEMLYERKRAFHAQQQQQH